jgi:formate hydrogenlyase subunit 3/multisubunit Na+/H+ antiporter MnhD subunit
MIQAFFAILISIVGIFTTVFSFFYERKNLFAVLFLIFFSFISLLYWYFSIAILLVFLFYKKLNLTTFITINMFTAIFLSWFFLNLFFIKAPYLLIGLISLLVLCALSIFGIFERNLKKYLLISNAIQILFVAADLSIGRLLGEFGPLSIIQIFNYTFAGLLFFLTVGIFGRGKTFVYELEGSYFANRWNDIFATIACLSLAGLPAFNMFVSEWLLFTKSFVITPVITILGVFAALLLFIMYYKVVYFLLIGKTRQKNIPKEMTILNGILAVVCVVFGILPQIQLEILSRVII